MLLRDRRSGRRRPARSERHGAVFRHGTFALERVQGHGSADLVVLAIIEGTRVVVGGPPAQDRALRVTLVYRRDGSAWRLVHRPAGPLAAGISLARSAALPRGEAQ